MEAVAARSILTPSSNRQGSVAQLRQFKISDIPAAMDNMNWPVAAALMRHWFLGDPWPAQNGGMPPEVKQHRVRPPAKYVEETIVKMGWVLQHRRASAVLGQLRANWNNSAALPFIQANVIKRFSNMAPGSYPLSFGGCASAAEDFGYFNSRSVMFNQTGNDEINELRGALGNFNMRVIAEGSVVVSATQVSFKAERLGFYAEDNYDFNDDGTWISQPLGFWSFDGLAGSVSEALLTNHGIQQSTSSIASASLLGMNEARKRQYIDLLNARYFLIQNSHFDRYRELHNKGGDFRVFSDIHYESLPTPVIFTFGKML